MTRGPHTPPRLALFDLDGTLADSRALMFSLLQQAAETFGFRRIDAATAEALRGEDSRAILATLGVKLWKLPRIANHLRALASAAPPPPLFPGVPEMLAGLHRAGITLALVSSNTEANARRALGPDTAALFSHWACDASLFGKAARFRLVLKRAHVQPSQAIAIGDELRDIAAARATGLAIGAVTWGYALPSALREARPDALFASVAEILDLFIPAVQT